MVRRDGGQGRCFTRGGHDWADRFPAIADAARRIKATSFLIDGEAVIARGDGTPDFHALRSKRRGGEAMLFAFDLIEHDDLDLRDLPLSSANNGSTSCSANPTAGHPVCRATDG